MARWLNADEAAVILRTTSYQITKMARAGQFTYCKWVGNRVRILESELDPPAGVPMGAAYEHETVRDEGLRLVRDIRRLLDDYEAAISPRPVPDGELAWPNKRDGD